jgi:AhpD family alkylhydroperoxidase
MDERLTELIAMGASAAVNCRPCLEYHLAACDRLGVPRGEVRAAVKVGQMVNRGAAARTREYVGELFGETEAEPSQETAGADGTCCT